MRRSAGLSICLTLTLAMAAGHCQEQAASTQTALALEQQGRNSEAEAAWRAVQKARPSSPEPYAHLGLLAARQERYQEAVPFYRRALALNPTMPGVHLNLGLALFKGGELKQAIAEFEPLLKAQPPGSAEGQRLTILIGMAHYGLGDYALAASSLRQAAAGDPQNLPLRMTLAQSCMWSDQYQCVLDTYREILTLNAESAEADMLAGEALDEMKDNAGSTKMFRAAVKANPREPNVHFGLGYLLWTQKQYPEAASEFQAELANDPEHTQAMLYLADSQVQLNRKEEAQPLLEKVVLRDPSLALGHLDLGVIYSDADRKEEALRELQAAAKLAPNDVNAHWRLGRLYRAMGKNDEAKAELAKASTLNKAADEDLYKKIANGHPKPPDSGGSTPAPPNQ